MPSDRSQRRSDIRLLLGSAIALIIGGILVAAAILAVTSRGKINIKVALPFGSATDIQKRVHDGGPVYIAGPSGDNGFWVAIEQRRLVALPVHQPKPAACTLRWRGSKNTFTCDDRRVTSEQLVRYRSFTRRAGAPNDSFMVRLNRVLPAPA